MNYHIFEKPLMIDKSGFPVYLNQKVYCEFDGKGMEGWIEWNEKYLRIDFRTIRKYEGYNNTFPFHIEKVKNVRCKFRNNDTPLIEHVMKSIKAFTALENITGDIEIMQGKTLINFFMNEDEFCDNGFQLAMDINTGVDLSLHQLIDSYTKGLDDLIIGKYSESNIKEIIDYLNKCSEL